MAAEAVADGHEGASFLGELGCLFVRKLCVWMDGHSIFEWRRDDYSLVDVPYPAWERSVWTKGAARTSRVELVSWPVAKSDFLQPIWRFLTTDEFLSSQVSAPVKMNYMCCSCQGRRFGLVPNGSECDLATKTGFGSPAIAPKQRDFDQAIVVECQEVAIDELVEELVVGVVASPVEWEKTVQ